MNKKFVKFLSLVLTVMVLFTCFITASATDEETPAPEEKITVSLRVEGLTENLANKTVKVTKSSTVKEVLLSANISIEIAEDGKTITSILREGTVLGSVWQYAVDGVIKTEAIDTATIENDAKLVVFNAAENAVMPSFKADEIALSGVIEFIGTDKNGTTAPIANAKVSWETKSGDAMYTTDAAGKVYLSQDVLSEGKHTLKISAVNDNNIPTVVRLEAGSFVDVPEVEGKDDEFQTFFEKAYNFLYSILKGVVEVWAFYISSIVGLFKGSN